MNGKGPTKKQRIFLKNKKLNDENWLVHKDTPQVQKGRQSDEGINIIEK